MTDPLTDPMPLADELSAVSARMSGVLLSEETVASALALVTTLISETMPDNAGAGVTLIDARGRKTTAAATDPQVERADAVQYVLNEGPCLSAWATRSAVRVDDLATETRWPRWCAAATPLGLHSALSAPMVAGDVSVGAIKVYGRQPSAFDERSERLLSLFAGQAAVLVANVQTHEAAQRLSEDLRAALRSRDVIGQAKGVLMSRGIDEDAAFLMLASASQRENRKLVEIARGIVEATQRRRR